MPARPHALVLRVDDVRVGRQVGVAEGFEAGVPPQRLRVRQRPPLLAHATRGRQRRHRQQRQDVQHQLLRQQRLDRRQRLRVSREAGSRSALETSRNSLLQQCKLLAAVALALAPAVTC